MTPTFDAHVHLWERQWEDYIVGTGRSGRLDQLALLRALMERHGIQRACLIGGCDASHPNNNEFIARICREHADRFVMLSEIPLHAKNRDELLDKTLTAWPARGFRCPVPLQATPDEWQTSSFDRFWQKVNDASLCVALNAQPSQLARLGPLIAAYQRITWLIDHMGRPRHDMSAPDFRPVLELAGFDRVYVKVSGFYGFTQDTAEYPYCDLHRFVIALRDAYGSRRLLWGSDVPPVLDFSSYTQTFRCLHHIPGLTSCDLEWILGRTAEELFHAA